MLVKDCFVSAAKVVQFLLGAKLTGHKAEPEGKGTEIVQEGQGHEVGPWGTEEGGQHRHLSYTETIISPRLRRGWRHRGRKGSPGS